MILIQFLCLRPPTTPPKKGTRGGWAYWSEKEVFVCVDFIQVSLSWKYIFMLNYEACFSKLYWLFLLFCSWLTIVSSLMCLFAGDEYYRLYSYRWCKFYKQELVFRYQEYLKDRLFICYSCGLWTWVLFSGVLEVILKMGLLELFLDDVHWYAYLSFIMVFIHRHGVFFSLPFIPPAHPGLCPLPIGW